LERARTAVPFHFHGRSRDILPLFCRGWNERAPFQPETGKELSILTLYLVKSNLREIHQIHFINDDNNLLDAEQAEQISVPAALLTHAFVSSDHQDRSVGTRRSRDHIFQKLFVTRRINDGVATSRRPKRDLSRVDRDVLLLLFEQRIEQESKFELHPFTRAGLLYFIDFSLGKRAGVRSEERRVGKEGR